MIGTTKDAAYSFLEDLIEDKTERKIVRFISQGLEDEKILDELIHAEGKRGD